MEKGKRTKLMLVGKDQSISWSLKASLRHKYSLTLASDSNGAIIVLKKTKGVKVIITDASMSVSSNNELLSWLNKNQPKVIRVLFASFAKTDVIQVIEKGNIKYHKFVKPWDINKIRDILDEIPSLNKNIQLKINIVIPQKTQDKCIIVFKPDSEYKQVFHQAMNYLKINIFTFNKSSEVLKTLQTHREIPAIVIDINVGDNDFINIVNEAKSLIPNVSIIALAENNHPLIIKLLNKNIACQVVNKPLTINKIMPLIMKSIYQFKSAQGKKETHFLYQRWNK